jgi:hypothetical protein
LLSGGAREARKGLQITQTVRLACENGGRDWNLSEIVCKMLFITNLYASRKRTCSVLKGANLAEEGVLGTGDNDFLSVGKEEENVGGVKQTSLFDVREVYNAVTRDAKERRGIEPSLAIPQYAPDDYCAVEKLNSCLIAAGLKKPDVGRPKQPALPIISQKNKVIGAESVILFFHGRLGTTFEHRRVENLILRSGVHSTFYFATMRRDALPEARRRESFSLISVCGRAVLSYLIVESVKQRSVGSKKVGMFWAPTTIPRIQYALSAETCACFIGYLTMASGK